MENFKEIAEKCLAGKLSGTFIIQGEKNWHSSTLSRHMIAGHEMPGQYVIGPGVIYNEIGQCESIERIRIIDFIPDEMQKKIEINIPEGMEVIQEETPSGIRIKFIKKSLSYTDIENKLSLHTKIQIQYFWDLNVNERHFSKKIEVLRKLTNIRNYFGKPSGTESGFYIYKFNENEFKTATTGYPAIYANDVVAFAKREHAEQAIKMLGDELKYLFEPW